MIVRAATPADAPAMVELLNAIIAKGGTTANQTPFDQPRMLAHCIVADRLVASHVAMSGDSLAGFQYLGWATATDDMPAGWAVIASFVDGAFAGRGVGRGLMEATIAQARLAGVKTIDATIRADNASGLGYYRAMGFVDYDRLIGVPLADGTPVDRIRKRLDL